MIDGDSYLRKYDTLVNHDLQIRGTVCASVLRQRICMEGTVEGR